MRGVLRRTPAPGPAALPPRRAGGQKRILAALTAVVLLVSGWWTYAVDHAEPARAATAAPAAAPAITIPAATVAATTATATATADMDVSVNPNSVTPAIGSISAVATYACTKSNEPDGRAQLRLEFRQGLTEASNEVSVPCGPSRINATQRVSAVALGFTTLKEITVTAILSDGVATVTSTARTVSDALYVHIDPSATYNGVGYVSLSGYYICSPDVPTPGTVFVNAQQVSTQNQPAAGYGSVPITTCDNTLQAWSVTFSNVVVGGGGFSSDFPLDATATGTISSPGAWSYTESNASAEFLPGG
ncbi:hypothetical protein ABZ990_24590 [Streptomyces sp. NPDC046203]|uniref:hypothetical protein n=1 Tax=Streptomyces sp. NPDC046203 TaxID=3154602 RepID=UPI0033C3C880